jgi:hypothetical protein
LPQNGKVWHHLSSEIYEIDFLKCDENDLMDYTMTG